MLMEAAVESTGAERDRERCKRVNDRPQIAPTMQGRLPSRQFLAMTARESVIATTRFRNVLYLVLGD